MRIVPDDGAWTGGAWPGADLAGFGLDISWRPGVGQTSAGFTLLGHSTIDYHEERARNIRK